MTEAASGNRVDVLSPIGSQLFLAHLDWWSSGFNPSAIQSMDLDHTLYTECKTVARQ